MSAPPAPGSRPAPAGCLRCRQRRLRPARPGRARRERGRRGSPPPRDPCPSSRRRRSRRSVRSGSSGLAGSGRSAHLRPRRRGPHLPCAQRRADLRSARPWSHARPGSCRRRWSWRSGSAPGQSRAPASPCRVRSRPRPTTSSGSNRSPPAPAAGLGSASRRCPRHWFRRQGQRAPQPVPSARPAGGPVPSIPRPRRRRPAVRSLPARRRPASEASICRCRGRRRSAAPNPARSRRR